MTSATVVACSADMPARSNTARTKFFRASAVTVRLPVTGHRSLPLERKVLVQPVAEEVDDQGIAFREHEMIHVGHQVQVGRLAGTGEEIERLLGGGDGVVRG